MWTYRIRSIAIERQWQRQRQKQTSWVLLWTVEWNWSLFFISPSKSIDSLCALLLKFRVDGDTHSQQHWKRTRNPKTHANINSKWDINIEKNRERRNEIHSIVAKPIFHTAVNNVHKQRIFHFTNCAATPTTWILLTGGAIPMGNFRVVWKIVHFFQTK